MALLTLFLSEKRLDFLFVQIAKTIFMDDLSIFQKYDDRHIPVNSFQQAFHIRLEHITIVHRLRQLVKLRDALFIAHKEIGDTLSRETIELLHQRELVGRELAVLATR